MRSLKGNTEELQRLVPAAEIDLTFRRVVVLFGGTKGLHALMKRLSSLDGWYTSLIIVPNGKERTRCGVMLRHTDLGKILSELRRTSDCGNDL